MQDASGCTVREAPPGINSFPEGVVKERAGTHCASASSCSQVQQR